MIRVAILLVVISSSQSCIQNGTHVTSTENNVVVSSSDAGNPDCTSLNLNYLVVVNEVRSENMRHIEIFLDVEEFNEKNLRKLFRKFSNTYSHPKYLTLVVKTHWSQLELPSDCPLGGTGKSEKSSAFTSHHRAIFYRHEKTSFFRYSTDPHSDFMKEIVID